MALAEQIVTSTIPYRVIRQLANHPRTEDVDVLIDEVFYRIVPTDDIY